MIQRVRQRQIRKTLLNVDDESEISAVAESKKIYREISPSNVKCNYMYLGIK